MSATYRKRIALYKLLSCRAAVLVVHHAPHGELLETETKKTDPC